MRLLRFVCLFLKVLGLFARFEAEAVCMAKVGSSDSGSKEALSSLIRYEICGVLAELVPVVVLGSTMETKPNQWIDGDKLRRNRRCRPRRTATDEP
jgi:hypothetical protein